MKIYILEIDKKKANVFKDVFKSEDVEGVCALGISVIDLHVSGHADRTAIKELIKAVNPKKIEFVHTENLT